MKNEHTKLRTKDTIIKKAFMVVKNVVLREIGMTKRGLEILEHLETIMFIQDKDRMIKREK